MPYDSVVQIIINVRPKENIVAQMFQDETKYPDNRVRSNFVFLGYPYTPAIPADDYKRVISEVEEEFGIRMWYFLDEITTAELMRKVWRAILRADFCIFDTSDGNPNVAFELGLAVSQFKNCMTLLKTGTKNPLGSADLGYSERAEYTSAATLKEKIRQIILSKSRYIKLSRDVSYQIYDSNQPITREKIEQYVREIIKDIYINKSLTKDNAKKLCGNSKQLADGIINQLRAESVVEISGSKRGAKWVFSEHWVYHDHEVAGLA